MASRIDEQQGLLTGTAGDVEAVPERSSQVDTVPRMSLTRLRVGGVVLLCVGFVALGAVVASNYSPAHADASSSTDGMTVLMYPFKKGGKGGNATAASPCATVAPALPKPTKPPKPTKKPTTTPLPTSTPPPTPKPVKASPCATVAPKPVPTPKPAPASPCATVAPKPVPTAAPAPAPAPASPCATSAPAPAPVPANPCATGTATGTTVSTSKAAGTGGTTMNINIPYTTNNAPALSSSNADPALQSGIQKAVPTATSASVDTKSTSGGRLLQAGMATVWVKFTIVLSVLMDPVALLDLLVKQVKIIVQTTNAMLGSIEVDAIVDITKAIGVWGPTGQYFSRSPSLPSPMPEPEPEPEAEVPP